jgi:AmmeMemoRadiSam system protein A
MGHDQNPHSEVQVDRQGGGKVAPDVGLETDGICRVERAGNCRWADGRMHGAPLETASTLCRSGDAVHGLPALHRATLRVYVGEVTTHEDPFVAVARSAIRHYLATGEIADPPSLPDDPPPSGVFVSLHEPAPPGHAEGLLRGCIGTIRPREPSVRSEIARSAVSAAVSDPRFPPLQPGEVDGLEVTVYLLDAPEPIDTADQLDPVRYGVIVEGPGGRSGLLLPAIPGITTAEQQVDIATRKAGLSPADPVRLSRFSARISH